MKASDYIVQYLINRGVRHVFGYPGGMVTHLMDSLAARSDSISSHVMYHEQGASFAACGYAQACGEIGVAYATSGPGATNLITGICNAWFDSIPVLFITGQVNSFETKGSCDVRQKGFQETDIVTMVESVTKYASRVTSAQCLNDELNRAFEIATSGRKGPVLLDICMDVMRSEVEFADNRYEASCEVVHTSNGNSYRRAIDVVLLSSRPVILAGNGVKAAGCEERLRTFIESTGMPCVSSMLAVDVVGGLDSSFGFIGAYGSRSANFVVAKSDLVIALGARLDIRQVGAIREAFAPDAKIIRVDIDKSELGYKVHSDEIDICGDVAGFLTVLGEALPMQRGRYDSWLDTCKKIRDRVEGIDDRKPNKLLREIGKRLPDGSIIVSDVGQNQVWVAQSMEFDRGLKVFTSGGHGAMGYSLPAAIGCCIARNAVVCSICGDGGFQMNIQELQTVVREQLPVKIIVVNNSALGMIRHFQEMYFDKRYAQTTPDGGYTVPDFSAIASAYGLNYRLIRQVEDVSSELFEGTGPQLLEVRLDEETYVFPKLEYGKPNQDQEPLLDRTLYNELMAL